MPYTAYFDATISNCYNNFCHLFSIFVIFLLWVGNKKFMARHPSTDHHPNYTFTKKKKKKNPPFIQ